MTVTHPSSAGRFVGHSIARTEDPRLLTGHGHYVDDVHITGMLHAAFRRSDVARGRITHLDVTAAAAVPGVHLVLVGADLNPHAGVMIPSIFVDGMLGPVGPIRPLAGDDVRFVGDPIALVIADTRYIAEDACDLIDVEIEPLPPQVDYEAVLTSTEVIHPEQGTNVVMEMSTEPSEASRSAWAGAERIIEKSFHQHRYSPVAMETRGVVSVWDPFEQRLDVTISSQNPHEVRLAIQRTTGVPEHRIRVRSGDVGGGFGQKSMCGREELAVILASTLHGLTVKWIEDRREDLIAGYHARQARADCKMGFDAEGRIVAAYMGHLEDTGAYPLGGGASSAMACSQYPGPYRIPLLDFWTAVVWTNTGGRCAYRGPWQMESVAREQMLEHCARELGIDPLELRRRNVLHRSEMPYTSAGGNVIENVTPEECLEAAAETIGYDAFRTEQRAALAEGRYLGIGTCLYIEPSPTLFAAYSNEPVHIRIHPDGHVDVTLGSGAHGQGLETTTAQLTAEYLGVDFADVTVRQGDTDSSPFGPGTGGSRSGPMIGATVIQAAGILQTKILSIAAQLLEAAVEDLVMERGTISVVGTPSRSVTISDVATMSYQAPYLLPEGVEPGLEVVNRYTSPPTIWSNACHMVTVEVDITTGVVQLLRYVVAEDCGRMINPNIVEGQITGGVIQGIGGVLFEENAYDDMGNPLATTFMDYLVPTATEVPPIEIVHLESPASTLGGFKGCGEGGAIGAPPAVFNAVCDALASLGVELDRQPLTPTRIWEAIAAADAAPT
jgi:carbon-monoxide dehydrogenase large subunit